MLCILNFFVGGGIVEDLMPMEDSGLSVGRGNVHPWFGRRWRQRQHFRRISRKVRQVSQQFSSSCLSVFGCMVGCVFFYSARQPNGQNAFSMTCAAQEEGVLGASQRTFFSSVTFVSWSFFCSHKVFFIFHRSERETSSRSTPSGSARSASAASSAARRTTAW